MIFPVSRIDTSLPLPQYQTAGAVAFDLLTRTDAIIPAKGIGFVPLNLVVKIPEGHMLMLAARSSLPKKKGLMLANSVGIIDQDFCGPEDELLACFYNFTDEDVHITPQERLVQGIVVKIEKVTFEEQASEGTSRGGFGTTGHN